MRSARSSLPQAWHKVFAPIPLLTLVSLSALAHAEKKVSVPSWVKEAATQTLPAYSPDTNAAILLDDITYTVGADLHAVEHERLVIKILRPQGRRYADLGTSYDGGSKIRSMHIWSIGPDGTEYALKDQDIVDVGAGGGAELYSDSKFRGGRALAGDPGAVVALEYEQESRPYSTEYDMVMQREIPILKARLQLELPAGVEYKAVWKGKRKVDAIDLEHGRYLWEVTNQPEINLRDVVLAPERKGLQERLTVHYYGPAVAFATRGDWVSIGEWYGNLAKGRNDSAPEIAAKAQELVVGKTDFADKVQAIGEYVQSQIRYVAIEIGIGGYQPHAAQDIFRNKYGDCKDKATLLSAMLSSVGIRSTWVMVDTARGVVDPNAPSLFGNHMIAAIEVPEGYSSPRLHSIVKAASGKNFLIFDPTWEYTPFGHLERNLQGGYGVLMDGSKSQAIAFPVLDPAMNLITRKGVFHLADDGTLVGSFTESRFGDIADQRRALFRTRSEKEQKEVIDRLLGHDLVTFSYNDLKVENLQELTKDLRMSLDLKAPGFAKPAGSLLMVRPRVLGSDALEADRKERKYAIDLDSTRQVSEDYEIEIPAGYVADELPDPVRLDVGFASYESSSVLKDNKLHYTRSYIVREIVLPAEKYPDVQKLAGVIGYDEHSRVVLKKAN